MSLVRVPAHAPCGSDGLADTDAPAFKCTTVRRWIAEGRFLEKVETDGCGREFPMCMHGLRACPVCHRARARAEVSP